MYNRNSSYWPYNLWQARTSYPAASVGANYVDFTSNNFGDIPANKISKADQGDYQPDPKLPSYNGPYPAYDLQRARQSLINSLTHDSSDILQRIKPRLGISSCYGPACKFSAPEQLPEDTSSVTKSNDGINNQPQNKNDVTLKQVTSSQASATATSGAQSQAQTSSQSKSSTTSTSEVIPKPQVTSPSEKINLKRKSDVKYPEGTPAKKMLSESGADITMNNKVYKCDFCNTQDQSKDVITLHLNKAKHFSASLYTTEGSRLVAVEKKLAVRQKFAKNEALAIMCPKCHDLFEDIFMCGMHYKYSHADESNKGYYSITPVIHVENIMVDSDPMCQKCGRAYENHRLLHRHWENYPKHHPVTKTLPENALCIYSCLYCDKTFYGDFYGCLSHVSQHKDQNGQVRALCGLKLKHILKPQKQEELLPMSPDLQATATVTGAQVGTETLGLSNPSPTSSKPDVAPCASDINLGDGVWTSPSGQTGLKKNSDIRDTGETPAKKVHSESGSGIAGNNQIYKCDFCNTQDQSKDEITLHLNQARHFSASLYTTKGSNLVAVEQKLAVRQKIAKNETLAVMCPKCHDLFEDIFMCGMHYKYSHAGESNEGYYSVTPIIHIENIMVNSDPRCQECDTVYEKHRLLHKHWDSHPSHHPVTKTVPKNALCIYSCLYCDKTFYGDFYGCKSHVGHHKDQNGQVRAVCAMKMRHVLKPQRKEELLPMSQSSLLNGLDDELKTLRNMKQHYKGMNSTKQKMKMIDGRLAFLKQFKLASTNNSVIS